MLKRRVVLNKLLSLILAVTMCAVMHSCADEPESTSENQKEAISHRIEVSDALSSLEQFLSSAELTSRGAYGDCKMPSIANVIAVNKSGTYSRADATWDGDNGEDLLYVANFENEQGFAILAADDRIGCDVIGVSESGSLQLNDFNIVKPLQRHIFPGYPTTGPGYYTIDEYPGQLFLNPNTVDLYVDPNGVERDEMLIGTFEALVDTTNNYVIDPGAVSTPITTPGVDVNSDPKQILSTLSLLYAINEINIAEQNRINYQLGDGADTPITDSGGYPITNTEKTISWSTVPDNNVEPLLSEFKHWTQGHPFNYYCPSRNGFIKFWERRKAKAGCFPLSIAKIMALYEYPPKIVFEKSKTEKIEVNWSTLKSQNPDVRSAGALLRYIGKECGSWYFAEGTFTFPWDARSFMRSKALLQNVRGMSYDHDEVVNSLDNGCPIICWCLPGIFRFDASHAWNIDGYNKQVRTTEYTDYYGTTPIRTRTVKDTFNMVHCDFGWTNQNCNGYYVSGIFKQSDSSTSNYDVPSKPKTDFSFIVKIISHRKPN